MRYRYLGNEKLKVSAVGYGCPPFQGKLSDADEKQAIAVLHRAIDIALPQGHTVILSRTIVVSLLS